MRASQMPVVKDLVLVGGGHSHVAVLKSFGMQPMPGVRVTLISRDVSTPYSGMLPGFIAGHYRFDECHIDLAPLSAFAGARFYQDEALSVDLAARHVVCAGRPPVPFDVLSLDIGSRPKQDDTPGAAAHTTAVKPIDGFAARWAAIVERVMADDRPLRIGVVGGGAGAVELTLAMRHRLHNILAETAQNPDRLQFVLVTAGALLPSHNSRAAAKFRHIFEQRKIELHLHSEVVRVQPGRVLCRNGEEIALDEILWVTQAGAAPWLATSGFNCDDNGFVRVRDTLQTETDASVFAAGDVAAVVNHPRPKAGVFAVRQGPPLTNNLRRVLAGRDPKPFVPQRNHLSLISTGDKRAIASRGAWAADGKWLWIVKDWIDRRFMRKYGDLPAMPSIHPAIPAAPVAESISSQHLFDASMRCGGCGSKLGGALLSRVLRRLDVAPRDDVLIGLDAPDDAALVRPMAGKMLVHTVDYFRTFVDDPYVFGRIAANHCLGDIYAMGAEPQSALAIANIPFGIENKIEDDLLRMMAGAVSILNDAQCALVGGHTGEGVDLALGFAITGAVAERDAMRKSGLVVGQALILTKPIGTGTLFAANMRRRAKGSWIAGALACMQIPARAAGARLRQYGATACTDVTGFGLVGHLFEMIAASGVDAELDLSAIPLLEGARESIEAGIFSSLQPQNMQFAESIQDAPKFENDPRYALLFDPQTAGGLLFGVPPERAKNCIAELRLAGYAQAAVIGRVLSRNDAPTTIRLVGGGAESPPMHRFDD